MPTYFTVGTAPLPARIAEKVEKDEEVLSSEVYIYHHAKHLQICPNLHFLGKRSTTKTSEGVKIVTLGGQIDKAVAGGLSKEQHLPFHTFGDAKAVHGANNADILLTTMWPASIRAGSKVPNQVGSIDPAGQEHISALCAALKPRYHLSTSLNSFFEREPFFHNATSDSPDLRPITRFISLAQYGNSEKQKYIYAFTLHVTVDTTAALPPGTTTSPFTAHTNGQKRAALEADSYSRYDRENSYRGKRGRGRRGERPPPPGPSECFFCLSNPNLSTHLISSIGDDAYLTTAKGPLTTSTTNAEYGLGFPCHALIIPLTHSPTLASIPNEEDARQKTFTEMTRFKNALQKMVAKTSDNKLGAITYEISKGNGVHTHWQFLPIPSTMIIKGLVEAAFQVEAENNKYPPFAVRDPGNGEGEGDFFRVWMWTPPNVDVREGGGEAGATKCITMPFDYKTRFSLQFGRTVLAKLLGLEGRIQWRDCAQSEDEEKKEIEEFKQAFKEFDFTL